eukprot:jgi/Botrbrau1/19256/Bobra.0073s0006.2
MLWLKRSFVSMTCACNRVFLAREIQPDVKGLMSIVRSKRCVSIFMQSRLWTKALHHGGTQMITFAPKSFLSMRSGQPTNLRMHEVRWQSGTVVAGMERDMGAMSVLPGGFPTSGEKSTELEHDRHNAAMRLESTVHSSPTSHPEVVPRVPFTTDARTPPGNKSHAASRAQPGFDGEDLQGLEENGGRLGNEASRGEGTASSSSDMSSTTLQNNTQDSTELAAEVVDGTSSSEGTGAAPAVAKGGAKSGKGPRQQGGGRTKRKDKSSVNPFAPKLKPLSPAEELLPLTEEFKTRMQELTAYKQVFGDCLVPRKFWDNPGLGEWCAGMRLKAREQSLSQKQIAALEALDFPWKADGRAIQWNFNLHELRRWAVEHGSIDVPFKWKDPTGDFSNEFAKWFHAQPTLFLQRRLSLDQVRKLLLVGYDVRKLTNDDISRENYEVEHLKVMRTSGKAEFEMMYKELVAWKEKYYTCVVPKQVYDNPVLGHWVHEIRKKAKEKKLDDETFSRLDAIGFCWTVDQQSAKWHHILHEARRYREVHGTGFVPPGYNNPREPGWIEAARWIQKNAKNFRKGKLTDKKYAMIRDIVGIKFVKEYGPGPADLVPGKIRGTKRKVPTFAVPKYDPSTRRVNADGVWDGY